MKAILLASTALMLSAAANAADMPVKAPQQPFTTNTGSGWYLSLIHI